MSLGWRTQRGRRERRPAAGHRSDDRERAVRAGPGRTRGERARRAHHRRLEVADAAAFFGEGSAVTLTVAGSAAPSVRAGLALPPGVELVDGAFAYSGELSESRDITLEGVLRASAPGEHVLRAWAERPMGPGSRAAPAVLLALIGDAEEARVEARSLPPPGFRVALEASDDLRSVRATLASDVAASARLEWVVPEVFAPGAVPEDENVDLEAGGNVSRTVELGAAERWGEGAYAVSVHLHPDAAVDGRLYGATLYFWWEGDELRAGTTPPGGATGAGDGPGAATGGDGNGDAPDPSP
jgi:hypothetical protein